ncbi:unnamed protein product [Macrosiphum euphorbiae]|uniref:Uncharacterized protein n=1 Tax=Macrosiphum euphorbiae TaxID=13131 RepID=A0AAV0X1J4_9HEMI|nr:unnamed protein product [Macrosiphum euphorbiae]
MTKDGRETIPQPRLQRILPHVITPREDQHTTDPQMLLVRQELQRVRRDPVGEMIYHREWARYFSQLRQKLRVDIQRIPRPPLSQPRKSANHQEGAQQQKIAESDKTAEGQDTSGKSGTAASQTSRIHLGL